jgi:hypothetical protein
MRPGQNILDKSIVIGLLVTCGSLFLGFLVPGMWQLVLWPSYLISLIIEPTTEGKKMICDIASVLVGLPVYSLLTYTFFYIYSKFSHRLG